MTQRAKGDLEVTTAKTQYVILRRVDDSQRWETVDDIEASSALSAVRKHHASDGVEGLYVAIPRRSWAPIGVRVERTEKLVIGPAAITTGDDVEDHIGDPSASPEVPEPETVAATPEQTEAEARHEALVAARTSDIDPDDIPF